MSEKEKASPSVLKNVTGQQLLDSYRDPALFVNKTVITLSGPFARLTFFEEREHESEKISHPRVTVVMSLSDLLKIRDLVTEHSHLFKTLKVGSAESGGGSDERDV